MAQSVDRPAELAFAAQSALVSALLATEALASFGVDLAVAAAFGLTAQADAFMAAWALPQTVGRAVFQSLTKSFMGIFASRPEGNRPYGPAIVATASLALPASTLLSLTAHWWLPLTVPGAGVQTLHLAVSLAKPLSWLVALLAVAETTRAVYYQEGRWSVPSTARLVGDLVAVGLLVYAARTMSPAAATWGLVCGAVVEAAWGLFGLWGSAIAVEWRCPSQNEWREMLGLVGAPLAGQSVRTVAGVVERAVASLLPIGSVAAVSHATRIIHAIDRFVLGGFVISAIRSEADGGKLDVRRAFGLVIWVGMLVAVVTTVLAHPLAQSLFARGRFSERDAATLATLVTGYGLTILGLAATRVPFALGYARSRPGVILGYFVVVSLGLAGSLVWMVNRGLGLVSFGLSQAIGVWAAFGWLYVGLLRPEGEKLWTRVDAVRWLIASGIVYLATTVARVCLGGLAPRGSSGSWLVLAGGVAAGVVAWLACALLMGVDEVVCAVGWVRRRLRR